MQARPGEPEHPARPPQAKPLPAQPMHNPLGPSDCIAASSSPMPRPPPPTRCAVAMVAAPGKAQACAIPIHKEIDHAIQETAGVLCRHAAACDAVPSCRPGVGRPYRRSEEHTSELAACGLREIGR